MSYDGIFVRDQLGQTPSQPSAGWSGCPDVIFNGKTVSTNPDSFTSAANYAKSYPANVYINQNNYVYLRGLNTNAGAQASHMFFYYTESDLMLWPKNWRSDHITVNGQNQNWSMLNASEQNKVAVTMQPFVWVPPPLKGSQYDHYCVIEWADNNGTTPTPPDLASLSQFSSCQQLAAFIQQHKNMGWRNTNDIYGTPPDYTFQTDLSLESGGGTVNLSISFIDIPSDGTFSVNLQGSDASNTIAASGLKISNYLGGFSVQGLVYPSDFKSSLQVQWFKGPTNPSPAAQVKVSITIDTSPVLIEACNLVGVPTNDIQVELFQATYALPHQSLAKLTPTPVTLLGRQTWNMKYGVNAPKA